MSGAGPPYRDYTDKPLSAPGPEPVPPTPGTGSVSVKALGDGTWTANWCGEIDEPGAYVWVDGDEATVLEWARSKPARLRRIFSDELDDYVPLR